MTRVHFIGICGTAMATLAAMLRRKGYVVSGSDRGVYPPMSDFLAAEGIAVLEGFAPERLDGDVDFVVIGNAVSRGNPEVEAVLDRGLRYRSLPETIREAFLWGATPVVVAGTHGKTTTTAMTGWLLTAAGLDPTVFVGGIAANLGPAGSSYRLGQGRPFVIEGDEYDSAFFDKTAKFLKYLPQIAVVNNVEFDHADIYRDLDAVRLQFQRLVNLVPRTGLLLLGSDSPHAAALAEGAPCRVQTFGTGEQADWRAHALAPAGFGTRFRIHHAGESLGPFVVPLPGAHNVRNALAAVAVGCALGGDVTRLGSALEDFRGVKRRLEVVGVARGVTVLDDFAHHPTAIAETLAGLRGTHPEGRIWAVFEPRSATSCRRVFQEAFVDAFAAADEVVLAGVFRTSIAPEERLSVDRLVADLRQAGRRARTVPRVPEIVALLTRECRAGDVVVCMSNGGFGGIHSRLVAALSG